MPVKMKITVYISEDRKLKEFDVIWRIPRIHSPERGFVVKYMREWHTVFNAGTSKAKIIIK
jgi:hypothetical protein